MNAQLFRAGLLVMGLIELKSPGVEEPPRLAIQRDDPGVVLTWAGNGQLESASAIQGPWTSLPGATSPHRIAEAKGSTFYRVRLFHTVSVVRSGTGMGTVRSSPEGVSCGGDCSEIWPAGETVVLQAIPEVGSRFDGWSGDCAGTGDCTITVDRARSVTATFTLSTPSDPFINGDFEQGPLVGWEQHPGQVIFPAGNLGGAEPYSGRYAAFLGMDPDGRRIALLGQRITLPDRRPLYLNFAAWLYSEELCDVPWYDRITLYIEGQVAFRDDRVCRGSGTDGWLRYSVDLTAVAGQSVAVVFEIYSADALASVLLLDDIAISDQPWGI